MTVVRGNSITFKDYSLEEACRRMAVLGYTSVEMWKEHLKACRTPELLRQFADYARSLGLDLYGLNSIGTGESYYFQPLLNSEGSINGLKREADYVLALGVRDILMWEGLRTPDLVDLYGEVLDQTVRVFRDAVLYSSERDVRILVEPHPFTLGMDTDFLIRLCDRIDSEHFGVIYDCCHYGVGNPRGYLQDIRRLNNRIKHIHFSDSDQRTSELHFPPGKGCLDLEGILDAFASFGYQGTITLDLYGYPLPEEASRIGIPYLREAAERLGIESKPSG